MNAPRVILPEAAAAPKTARPSVSFIRAVNLPEQILQQPPCIRIFGGEVFPFVNGVLAEIFKGFKTGNMTPRIVYEVDDIDVLRQDFLDL